MAERHRLEILIEDFRVSNKRVLDIMESFKNELKTSLNEGNKRMLKCLPSFVESPPKGTETGEYIVIDLGGTNLRVGHCKLLGGHLFEQQHETCLVPDTIKSGSGFKLFDFIAVNVVRYAMKLPERDYDVGFTFSFPVEQDGISHGRLIQFNKAYDCHDIVGLDVVKLLQERLGKLHPGRLTVKSLVNDTVGAFVAHGYINPATRMGVILGTGTNAAYFDNYQGHRMIINIEWGGFGDNVPREACPLPLTDIDVELDKESENKSKQTFEKMVSGMYLGELFRLAAKDHLQPGLEEPYSLDTKDLGNVSAMLRPEVDKTIVNLLSQLASVILDRSARLAAALITAVYQHARDGSPFVVAIDGSLFTKNATYQRLISLYTAQYSQSQDLVIETSKGEPLVGSGIIIAAAESR